MELHDLIYSRHSVRNFKDQDVSDEDILKILDAVRVGPSSENSQNWHFIVVKNRDFMNKLADVIRAKLAIIVNELKPIDEKRAERFEKFINKFVLFFLKAPVLLMVYSFNAEPAGHFEFTLLKKPKEDIDHLFLQSTAMQGLGASLEHGVLTLMELGYGTCLMTGQNWADKEIEELVKQEIGFSRDGWFLANMMPIGVPDGELKSPGRKPLEEMVTFYK